MDSGRVDRGHFFYMRVTHVNSTSQAAKTTTSIIKSHEASKKREYLQRMMDIEHKFFTQLVFGTNRGMGKECKMIIKHLSTTLAEKTNQSYADTCCGSRHES